MSSAPVAPVPTMICPGPRWRPDSSSCVRLQSVGKPRTRLSGHCSHGIDNSLIDAVVDAARGFFNLP